MQTTCDNFYIEANEPKPDLNYKKLKNGNNHPTPIPFKEERYAHSPTNRPLGSSF